MSFKNETLIWLRDIRHFAFHIPANKYLRAGWIWVMGMWILFFAVLVWAITHAG